MSLTCVPSANGELALPGAQLLWRPGWLETVSADCLLAALQQEIPWETHRIRLFGRLVDSPRLSCWMGDSQARYRYSGSEFRPHPWHPALHSLAERLQAELSETFNSVLANRYRDGRDAMGWHSDDEPELGPAPVIASVSLGASRRFVLKHRDDPAQKLALELDHGSLLVMAGATQRHYKHALPRTARPVGERINLTFRHILPR
ncbi:MAG TPA: alpha-ketoglutarate-dependent dioxygenase AlkB [Pseudoxanthomonas sp.]|jgi:alkylated DNA repair dioxygenase AlkB|nr:alpha-ketoglutarate-dependent dioxygenase AlkB [Pseudoxanthomonas sp.]